MSLNQWKTTKPFTDGSFHSVAYGNAAGNDQFVAVGPPWIISSRDEGATWQDHTIRTGLDPEKHTKSYYAVAYGDGVFVAVGAARVRWDGNVLSDQISQTVKGITNFLQAIAHGAVPLGGPGFPKTFGLFVAVGDAGTIVTSRDGLNWAAVTWPTSWGTPDGLRAIAFGNQRFVAAGSAGTILVSLDGVTWSKSTLPSALRTLTFGPNGFVGVDDAKKVLTSADGASWTTLGPALPTAYALESIDFGFDTFALSGAGGSIHTSRDGIVWISHPTQPLSTQALGGIAYGKNRFVAVGAGGSGGGGTAAGGDIVRSGEYPSADLSALTTSAGPLTPVFDPASTAYLATLPSGIGGATVTPTSEDAQATITVRLNSGSDVPVTSGTSSAVGQITFRGTHTFSITVTARNNAKKLYTVGVDRSMPLIRRILSWFWPFR